MNRYFEVQMDRKEMKNYDFTEEEMIAVANPEGDSSCQICRYSCSGLTMTPDGPSYPACSDEDDWIDPVRLKDAFIDRLDEMLDELRPDLRKAIDAVGGDPADRLMELCKRDLALNPRRIIDLFNDGYENSDIVREYVQKIDAGAKCAPEYGVPEFLADVIQYAYDREAGHGDYAQALQASIAAWEKNPETLRWLDTASLSPSAVHYALKFIAEAADAARRGGESQ